MSSTNVTTNGTSNEPDPPRAVVKRNKLCRPKEDARLFSEPVTLIVGKDRKEYVVHENVLRSTYGIFPWSVPPSERIIDLTWISNDCVEAFEVYTNWLYSGLFFLEVDNGNDMDTNGNKSNQAFDMWTGCYNLGICVADIVFLDAAIDALIELIIHHGGIPGSVVSTIFSYDYHQEPHQQMIIDAVLHTANRSQQDQYCNDENFWLKFRLDRDCGDDEGVKRISLTEFFNGVDTCKYHLHSLHPEYEACYKTELKDRL